MEESGAVALTSDWVTGLGNSAFGSSFLHPANITVNVKRVIIIDSIGILLTLYTYAHAAYIGGGFKQNIHNVLEAAVYGIPVIFGPKYDNSQEAKELLSLGGGTVIRNKKEAYRIFRALFTDDTMRKEMGTISFNYVQKNLGATDKIIQEIKKAL